MVEWEGPPSPHTSGTRFWWRTLLLGMLISSVKFSCYMMSHVPNYCNCYCLGSNLSRIIQAASIHCGLGGPRIHPSGRKVSLPLRPQT